MSRSKVEYRALSNAIWPMVARSFAIFLASLPWSFISFIFDTHAIARALTAADLTDAQADAITDAVRQAAEHGEHVTPERLRAELAALETRLIKWMVG